MRGAAASIAEMAAKAASRTVHRNNPQQYKNLLAPSPLQTSAPPELKSHHIAEARFSRSYETPYEDQADIQEARTISLNSPHGLNSPASQLNSPHAYIPAVVQGLGPHRHFEFPRVDHSKGQSSRSHLDSSGQSAATRSIPRHSPAKYSTIRGQLYNYTSMQQYSKRLVDIKTSLPQTEKPLATAGQQQMLKFKAADILTSPQNRQALSSIISPSSLLLTMKGGKLDAIDLSVLQQNYPSKEIEMYYSLVKRLKTQDPDAIKQAMELESLGLQITPYQHTKNGVTGKVLSSPKQLPSYRIAKQSENGSILSSIESTGKSAAGSQLPQEQDDEEYKIEVRLGTAESQNKLRGQRHSRKMSLEKIRMKINRKQPYSFQLQIQQADPYCSTSQLEAIDLLADSLHIQKCEMNKQNIEELINSLPRSVKISPPDDWPPPHLRKDESKERLIDAKKQSIILSTPVVARKTYSKGFSAKSPSEVSTAASVKRKPALPKVPLKKKEKALTPIPPPAPPPRKPRPPVQPRRKHVQVEQSEYSEQDEDDGEDETQGGKRRKFPTFSMAPPAGMYTYIVQKGNSSHLVSQALARRGADWIQTHHFNTLFHFKWTPISQQIKFERIQPTAGYRQLVNHFEHHWEVSTKDNLFNNMLHYCELNKRNVFDIVPLTFVVEVDAIRSAFVLEKFAIYFNIIQTQIDAYKQKAAKRGQEIKEGQAIDDIDLLQDINKKLQTFVFSNERRAVTHTRPGVPPSHFAGQNIWLLKPTSFNRGRGVHLFNTLEQLKKLLKEMTEGQGEEGVKSSSFVIQKYIERPLLIEGRKFDIRQWILVTQDLNCYFFKEAYVRTSANQFGLTEIDKRFVHLTNNAVQKYADNYGQFEQGNILSFEHFQEFFPEIDVKEVIVNKMQELVTTSMLAVRKKLNSNDRSYCFEIFGYDFMVDENFKLWLIEVNTNPCMEESNAFLKMLLPRMVDDALKLTLDVVFPPKRRVEEPKSVYPVEGHADTENLWEFLVQLQHPSITRNQRIQNYCKTLRGQPAAASPTQHEEQQPPPQQPQPQPQTLPPTVAVAAAEGGGGGAES